MLCVEEGFGLFWFVKRVRVGCFEVSAEVGFFGGWMME